MMIKARQFSYVILLLITITLTSLLIHLNGETKITAVSANNQPDAYANNILVTRYNHLGQLATQLIAPKMIHFSEGNISVFLHPRMTLYTDKQPWLITADKAQTINGFINIIIIGHVKLHEPTGPNNPDTTITTSKLKVNTQQQTGVTEQPIQLVQKNHDGSWFTLNAIGLTANQKTGEIKLLSHVRGYYVPPPTTTNVKS